MSFAGRVIWLSRAISNNRLILCVENIPAADLGSGVHIALGCGGTKPMQGIEAYVEGEQNLEVRIRGKDTREMQDVLSRCRPFFYRAAY